MIASMEAVVRCGELKEIAFTCPLALMGRTGHNKRNPDDSWDPPGKRPRGKGKGKEKGKVFTDGKGAGPGKSKSKGKKGDGKNKGLLHMTPDGRQICFGYNDGTCTDANCGRVTRAGRGAACRLTTPCSAAPCRDKPGPSQRSPVLLCQQLLTWGPHLQSSLAVAPTLNCPSCPLSSGFSRHLHRLEVLLSHL